MHDDQTHPLLQQTPLSVNPFIDLPKTPTLPHNYASLPSTLPPSSMNVAPVAPNPELPAYVTSSSGFAAHPSTVVAQNKALLEQLERQRKEAREQVVGWERSIRDRELQEKRRTAPGWLDSESKLLQPEKVDGKHEQPNLMDEPEVPSRDEPRQKHSQMDDLGAAMDRAFGDLN